MNRCSFCSDIHSNDMGEFAGFLTSNRFTLSGHFLGETVDATHAIIHCFPCHQWVMAGRLGHLKTFRTWYPPPFSFVFLLKTYKGSFCNELRHVCVTRRTWSFMFTDYTFNSRTIWFIESVGNVFWNRSSQHSLCCFWWFPGIVSMPGKLLDTSLSASLKDLPVLQC